MEKKIEYKIIASSSSEGLEKLVQTFLNDGFEPLGSLAVNNTGLFQCIVRYKEAQAKPMPFN